MGSLFWKFLIAFWLTLVAAGAGVGLVVWLHKPDDGDPAFRRMGDPRAAVLMRAAASTLAHGGPPALRDWLEAMAGEGVPPLYAVDGEGRELLGRPVDPAGLAAARSRPPAADGHAPVEWVEYAPGQGLLLFMPAGALHPPGMPPPRFMPGAHPGPPHGPPPPWLPLIAAALASLLFSALLAWYVVKPIRKLREATRAVAAGHLETRILPGLGGRRDELGDLGRDFDAMTGKLEGLIGAQRRLFHDVSHELRSPLARLHAAIGLARQNPARLESGMVGPEPMELDVMALLEAVVDDARFEAETLGRRIDSRIDSRTGGPARSWGRPDLIGRALENVIRNAIRHSPAGAAVEVVGSLADAGGTLLITVSDRGEGVPESELEAIFEPFYRGGKNGGWDGYGLGLAIARRAVEAHGGSIRAANRPEGGLGVEIRLPLVALVV